jgi:hypothetical protein
VKIQFYTFAQKVESATKSKIEGGLSVNSWNKSREIIWLFALKNMGHFSLLIVLKVIPLKCDLLWS